MPLNVMFGMGSHMFSTGSRRRVVRTKCSYGSCPGFEVAATSSADMYRTVSYMAVIYLECSSIHAFCARPLVPVDPSLCLRTRYYAGSVRYQGQNGEQSMAISIASGLALGEGSLSRGRLHGWPDMPFHYVMIIRAIFAQYATGFLVPALEERGILPGEQF